MDVDMCDNFQTDFLLLLVIVYEYNVLYILST